MADAADAARAADPGGGPDVSEPASRLLEAGRVGRPHGLDGSFHVTRPRPRLLAVGTAVVVAGRTHNIVRRAGMDERPILRLAGIEDRTAAETLRGQGLGVALDALPPLATGEWWAHDLEGCAVRDGARDVGTVIGLLDLPSCEVLDVRRLNGTQLLVPMVKDAVRRVDVPGRTIEIDLAFLGEQ